MSRRISEEDFGVDLLGSVLRSTIAVSSVVAPQGCSINMELLTDTEKPRSSYVCLKSGGNELVLTDSCDNGPTINIKAGILSS